MMNSTFFRSTIQCFYGSHQPRLNKAQALVRAIMRTLRSVGSAVHQPPIPGRKLSFLKQEIHEWCTTTSFGTGIPDDPDRLLLFVYD